MQCTFINYNADAADFCHLMTVYLITYQIIHGALARLDAGALGNRRRQRLIMVHWRRGLALGDNPTGQMTGEWSELIAGNIIQAADESLLMRQIGGFLQFA
jgi:hypothetical protein